MAFVYGTGNGETLNALDGVTNSADLIFGLGGNDRIYGLGGDDEILGGPGADRIDGGSGNDTANYSDAGSDVYVRLLTGTGGQLGAPDWDTLVSIENLTGSAHDDFLEGNDGVNVLRGMAGDDDLFGLRGADTLVGGFGRDILGGGLGGDRFVWTSTAETGLEEYKTDLVVDFNFAEGDRIDLAAIDADVYAAGNQAFTFIGSAAFSGTPGEINYVHSGSDTWIQLQTGVDADVEAVIQLSGIHAPEADWFVL